MDVDTALKKIMKLPGMPAGARDDVRGVLEDLWVDARHEGTLVGDDPDAMGLAP
jgi:hypothetical protein